MKVAIIGSGIVGRSWAMIFASKGHEVVLFDIKQEIVDGALELIKADLQRFEKDGCLRGSESALDQFSNISGQCNLKEALKGVGYLQECVPENLELKHKVWGNIEGNLDFSMLKAVGSSASCLLPKLLFANSGNELRKYAMVSHPVNPPYFVPLVEIIPDEQCAETAWSFVRAMMDDLGQAPVVMKKQVDGFALNRLQYPVINAAWQLVRDGVMSAKDVDTVMVKGLGMRYACIGPFETCHLNANGIDDYFQRYTENIKRVSEGQIETNMAIDFKNDAVLADISKEMNEKIPLDENSMADAKARRDIKLKNLSKLNH